MTKAQMNFALELLRHSSQATKSALLSPFAVTSALLILHAGANGRTESEIREALFAGISFQI